MKRPRLSGRPRPTLPFLVEEAGAAAQEEARPGELSAGGAAALEASKKRPRLFEAGPEFRVVARLAVGGMAEVWLADALQGPLAGRTVVLKRLLPALRGDPATVRSFREEARLGLSLSHPNLAQVFGLHQRGAAAPAVELTADVAGDIFLVQELLGGETLAQLSAAARRLGERLSVPAALHAVAGLLAALSYLHEGPLPLVHADVNPDNLVARPDGTVKLIDLGLAQLRSAAGTAASPDGALRGTPAYMSPEQVKSRPLDARSDLFSAGVVLWELLANRPLFDAETDFETLRRVLELPAPPLRSVWQLAPTSLERLCVRALAKDPEQRFQTAVAFAEALHNASAREGLLGGEAALAAEVARLAPRSPQSD